MLSMIFARKTNSKSNPPAHFEFALVTTSLCLQLTLSYILSIRQKHELLEKIIDLILNKHYTANNASGKYCTEYCTEVNYCIE